MIDQAIPNFVWLAGNVAVASILLSLVGLLASRGFARLKPSSGHWGLVTICLLLLAVPLIHLVSQAGGIAWWKFDPSFAVPTAGSDQIATDANSHTTVTPFQIKTLVHICELVIFIWLFGTAVVAYRSIAEVVTLRRWIRMTKQCENTATLELVARAAKLAGTRIPQVRITSAAICPLVAGF